MKTRIQTGVPVLAFVLVFLFAGCGLGVTAEQRVDRAREYLAGDNAPAAIIELKNALQEDPVNVEARLLLAEASFQAGDPDTAVKEYERAIDLGADLERIRLAYAEALVRTGRAERALEMTDLALVPEDQQPRAEWLRGLALTMLRRLDEAEAAFDAARRDPALAFGADLGRVRLALVRGDLDTAREVLDTLDAAGATDSDYWETRAIVQSRDGDPRAAVASLRKAIDQAKDPFGARRFVLRGSLAEALLADGDVDEARKVAEGLYGGARQHPMPNYLMARVEYQAGNYQQALAYAQALLSIQPGSPIGNTLAGAATLAMNQPAQAESYLARAVDADPDNLAARKLLAQTRLGLGSPENALETLRPVAGLDAEVTSLAGMASIRAGDPEAAIQMFRSALAKDPGDEDTRIQLVVSLMAAGRNDEALAELGMLENLDDAAQLRADLIGVAVHLQAGDLAEARAAATAAAQARPADAQVRNSLGGLFLSAGQVDEAVAWFEDTLRVAPGDAAAEFNLGRIAAVAGRAEEAEARFKAVLAADPGNMAAKIALAQVSWSKGQRDEAIRQVEELRSADKSALQPRLLLVQYLQAEGRGAEALEVAREAATEHPQNADAVNSLGRMLLAAGQPAEALRAFGRAIDIAPGNAELLLNRARAYAATGEVEAAQQDLRNALAVDPEYFAARLALTDMERRSGRLDSAADHLARLKRSAAPGNAAVALLEGELLLARQDFAAAIPAFETARDGGIGNRADIGLYQARQQSGDAEAVSTLEEALAASPDDATVRRVAASHYLSAGDHATAIGHYEVLLRQQPDNAVMLNNLAWLYNKTGDARALATAERALEAAPESALIMDTLGWILHQKGESARALELIREAAKRAPAVPEIRYHFAVLLAESDDREGAVREARALLGDASAVQYHAEAQALLDRLGR